MKKPEPITFTLRLTADLSKKGFLRKCYDDWIKDVAYYKAHPEVECPADYLITCSFEQFVQNVAMDRVDEIADSEMVGSGFKLEMVERSDA